MSPKFELGMKGLDHFRRCRPFFVDKTIVELEKQKKKSGEVSVVLVSNSSKNVFQQQSEIVNIYFRSIRFFFQFFELLLLGYISKGSRGR